MKVTRQWFEEQPSPIREILLERYNPSFLGERKDLWAALIGGFDWSKTPEGEIFWRNIYDSQSFNSLVELHKTNSLQSQPQKPLQPTITVSNYPDWYRMVNFKFPNGYSGKFYYCVGPFMNCQNFSIAAFNQILEVCNDKQTIELINLVKVKVEKALLLIDINHSYINRVDKIFKESVMFKNEYKSTNNSEMCMYMINLNNLKS